MEETTKKTVGAASLELLGKGDQKQGVVDTQREMLKQYMDNLIECAERAKKEVPDVNPLYICVQTRRERTMQNVIRNQFYYRQTRPTPQFDLALYEYDTKTDDLKFQWQIPDKETCQAMKEDPLSFPKEEQDLVQMVQGMFQGTLL